MAGRIVTVAVVGALTLGVAACGSSKKKSSSASTSTTASITPATISGAGSTLAAPVYMQWGANLKSSGVTLDYNPSGSGAGVASLQAGTVGFAASDPPLTAADRSGLKAGPAVQIPTVLGAITVSYNLSGATSGLKLDGATIADIYLGKVTNWNDPEIAKLNPGMSLPATAITVVHRSDSSGTTKGFTTFLSDYSPQWKSKVGADKTVQWPVGTGATKNAGVAAAVKQTQGAIGYVEQAYALQNGFTYAAVKNMSGKFILPTLATTSAAGTRITIPAGLGYTAINSPNPAAYPIVSQTFLIAYRDSCKAGTMSPNAAAAYGAFVTYGLGQGQAVAKQLSYAPLPPKLLASAKLAARTLVCNGKPLGA